MTYSNLLKTISYIYYTKSSEVDNVLTFFYKKILKQYYLKFSKINIIIIIIFKNILK